nr:probable cytochrome P450 6u1 isoform X1 [Drosophila suzukii]
MELMHRVLHTALGALSVFYALVKISLGYWKRRGILHEKPKFLWGNIKGVVGGKRHAQDALLDIYASYKGRAPFVGFYACLKPFILVLDLKLVHQIIFTDSGHFTSRGLYSNSDGEPLSANLLQLDGNKWRTLHAKSAEKLTCSTWGSTTARLLKKKVSKGNSHPLKTI